MGIQQQLHNYDNAKTEAKMGEKEPPSVLQAVSLCVPPLLLFTQAMSFAFDYPLGKLFLEEAQDLEPTHKLNPKNDDKRPFNHHGSLFIYAAHFIPLGVLLLFSFKNTGNNDDNRGICSHMGSRRSLSFWVGFSQSCMVCVGCGLSLCAVGLKSLDVSPEYLWLPKGKEHKANDWHRAARMTLLALSGQMISSGCWWSYKMALQKFSLETVLLMFPVGTVFGVVFFYWIRRAVVA